MNRAKICRSLFAVAMMVAVVVVATGLFAQDGRMSDESAARRVGRDGRLVEVDYVSGRVSATDEELAGILETNRLEVLKVIGGALTEKSLTLIEQQGELRELFLQETPTTDDDLRRLVVALPKLRRLTLRRLPNLSDGGIAAVVEESTAKNLPLDVLGLIELAISDDAVLHLAKLRRLRSLDLRFCSRLRGDAIAPLAALPQLAELKLGGYGIDDTALESLEKFPTLRSLHLDQAAITPEGFLRLTQSRVGKRLTALSISRITVLGDDALAALGNCSALKSLTLRDLFTFGGFFAALCNADGNPLPLESLIVTNGFITDESLESLRPLTTLKRVDFSGCVSLTPAAVEMMKTVPNLEEWKIDGADLNH